MARLWQYVDGEPFLVNPYLGVIGNPKRKNRKGKAMARRNPKSRAHMAWVRSFRKKGRKNPPKRRSHTYSSHRRRARKNPPRRRRSGYRRNPSVLGMTIPPISQIVFAGVGFLAPPMVEGFLMPYIPTSISSSSFGKLAIRVLTVVGLTYAAKRFAGRDAARMVAVGGGVNVLQWAISTFAPGVIPGLGMYVPSSNARASLGEYVPRPQLRAMNMQTSYGNMAERFRKY